MEKLDHPALRSPHRGDVEISLMGLLRVVHRWRSVVVPLVAGVTLLTAVIMLLTPNVFTARGTILLEMKESPVPADFLGQLTALTGISSQAPSTETYLAILESRRVGEAVASGLDLPSHYEIDADTPEERMELTLLELDKKVAFDSPDLVTIHVRASDSEPGKATEIVNAYLDQLADANQTMALSRARRTRQLVERELTKTRAQVDSLMNGMRAFQEENGVFSLDEQTTGMVELITVLHKNLLELQTQRDAVAGFRQGNSAQLRDFDLQIQAIRARIKDLVEGLEPSVQGGVAKAGSGDYLLTLNTVPDLAERYAKMVMDQKVLEAKYHVLATRLEQTKIEESQSLPSFEILDRAVRPFRKSGPNRKLYVLAALLGSLLTGVLLAVLLEDLSRRLDPATRDEIGSMLPPVLRRRSRAQDPARMTGHGD
jgi:uncharacterized protein involved in exopolysaccharide biosynthesis